MTAEKRKRSVNFSTEEKMKFLRILKKKGQVIITKVTSHDLQTNRLKEDAWTEVTDELNASGSILRTKDNLKKLWQKMKTEAKTYTQTNGTSGGPTRMDDPVLEVVADLTGYGSSVGGSTYSEVESVYDCEPEIVFSGIKQEKSNPKRRWPTLCDDEQSNKSAKVSTPSNNNFASERLKCEKEKSALIELQKQHMTEEHALKIKHGELKTKILEAVLKKVQDEKPVDSELLKIVSNM